MKVVILAGGLGTRISEETITKPKPMIEIGSMPIIWHIMKYFSSFGHNDFIICAGYKAHIIKDFFSNYNSYVSDLSINFKSNNPIKIDKKNIEPWQVSIINTGEDTLTGGRIKRIYDFVKNESYFFMTYGDGLSNVNIDKLEKFHIKHNKLATVTAVRPPARFGYLNISSNDEVINFDEKNQKNENYINGGYFVLNPECIKLIESDYTSWEKEPMQNLTLSNNLMAFKHNEFWLPMDTLRDKLMLEELWKNSEAPWKRW